ncbi:unnamed protein product [Sphagnum jensenii]|uniref:DNA methylase N-4/N-6 domain-containing protein n=1 Tax=Sphagnum jensenii TaxID=128206 RepID=A0ABP0V9K9_9BRYO
MKGERFAYREVYWDENREKAANLAANKGAGEWDLPQLSTWLKDLSVPDLDFDLGLTMFDEDELKEYGGIEVSAHTRSETTGVDEDEVPEKAPARTKLGDIYQLGQHRLLCGDSTDLGTVEKLMDGQKADMVFTDPPYGMRLNVDYDDMFKNDASKIVFTGKRFKKVEGDDKDYDPNPIFSIIADDYFIWGADYFYDKLPSKGSWTAWDKRTNENMDKVVGNTTEFCWSKNPHRRMTARVLWSGHHGMQKDDTKTRVHPTQKPVALVEWFFNQYANKHKSIVDIYGGSGSTLIACEKTNRKCFMMELDPHYCDVIVERWEKYTGRKATLGSYPAFCRGTTLARINLEEKIWMDPRLKALSQKLGSEAMAIGYVILFWRLAQSMFIKGRLVTENQFKLAGLPDSLFDCEFAVKTEHGIRAKGDKKNFGWLVERIEAGRKGGKKTAEKFKHVDKDQRTQARYQLNLAVFFQMEDKWFETKSYDFTTFLANTQKVALALDKGEQIRPKTNIEKAFTAPRIDMIWNRLQDLDDDFMNKSTDTFLASFKFPPLPADFFELARLERNSPYRKFGIPTEPEQIHPSENSIFSKEDIAEMFSMMKKRLNGEISYMELEQYGKMIQSAVDGSSRRDD